MFTDIPVDFELAHFGERVVLVGEVVDKSLLSVWVYSETISVGLDTLGEGVAVVQPRNKTSVDGERKDIESDNFEGTQVEVLVLLKQVVDQVEELHHSFVLAQIFISFQEIEVLLVVDAVEGEFAGLALGLEHFENRVDFLDFDFAGTTRDEEFGVLEVQQIFRDVFEVYVFELSEALLDNVIEIRVEAPGLAEEYLVSILEVHVYELLGLLQVSAELVEKTDFVDGVQIFVRDLVKVVEHLSHFVEVGTLDVLPGFSNSVVPLFFEEYGYPDQLVGEDSGLLLQNGEILLDGEEDFLSHSIALGSFGLLRNQNGENQGLGKLEREVDKQGFDGVPNVLVILV